MRSILLTVDDTPSAATAKRIALALARRNGASIDGIAGIDVSDLEQAAAAAGAGGAALHLSLRSPIERAAGIHRAAYRLALTEFLGLHRPILHIPGRGKTWAKKLDKEIALQIDFDQHQEQYEDALDTFTNARMKRSEVHRRKKLGRAESK